MQASPESDFDYLEELESRLYSQVFHSTSGNEEFSEISKLTEVNCEVPLQTVRNYRYFMIPNLSKDIPSTSTFIPLVNHEPSIESKEKSDSPFIQNNISIIPSSATVVTDSNYDNIVQNNITVNQFTVPLIIQSDYPDNSQMLSPCTNGQYINPWSNNFSNVFYESPKHAETNRTKRFRRKRNRSKRTGKKESLANSTVEPSRTIAVDPVFIHSAAPVEVITLSDESSNECVLVEDIEPKKRVNTGFPKKYEENSGSKKPESDDDIIYIPPLPPVVINVDIDECEESVNITTLNKIQSKLSTETNLIHKEYIISNPIETSASNDFLDTASVDSLTKFNFGLHGADFNNQNDFVRPPNPEVVRVESCETESSCSTNEHSRRDFNNTVKTIVFNEVEFPKEDIFSEKNLESFKTFITPQRNSKSKTDFNEDQSEKISHKCKKVVDTSNSDSSTESDYEDPEMRNQNAQNIELNKMLPILSPMVSENEHVSNNKDNKKKRTHSGFHSSKRKSDEMNEFIPSRKGKKKTKCRKSNITLELTKSVEVSNNEKTRKKKRTSEKVEVSLSNKEETIDIFETCEQTVRIKSKKRKKNSELISTPVDSKDKSKKKKKKRDTIACANELEPVLDTFGDENKNVHVEKETKEAQLDDIRSKVASSTFEQNNMETIDIEDFVVVDSIDNDLSGVVTGDEASTIDINKVVLDYEYDSKLMENDLNLDVTLELTKSTDVSDNEKPRQKKKSSEKQEVPLFASTPKRKTLSESNTEETTELFETIEQPVEIKANKRTKKFELISRTLYNKKSKKKKKKRDSVECAVQLEHGLNKSREDNKNVYVEIETEEAQLDDKRSKETPSILDQNNTEPITIQDFQIIDSIHNDLSELITIDEASITDVEVVDSDIEDHTNEAVVENDLQLANCITISQPAAVISNDSFNTEIQLNQHHNVDKPFNMDDILGAQSDDPEKWQVSFKDGASYLYMSRVRGPRCNKCRQIGHTAMRCTEKPDEPACILCGIRGHEESRCTVKMCNQCGRHGDYNVKYCRSCFTIRDTECRLCHMPGHLAKYCPDLWRRYHLTTEDGSTVENCHSVAIHENLSKEDASRVTVEDCTFQEISPIPKETHSDKADIENLSPASEKNNNYLSTSQFLNVEKTDSSQDILVSDDRLDNPTSLSSNSHISNPLINPSLVGGTNFPIESFSYMPEKDVFKDIQDGILSDINITSSSRPFEFTSIVEDRSKPACTNLFISSSTYREQDILDKELGTYTFRAPKTNIEPDSSTVDKQIRQPLLDNADEFDLEFPKAHNLDCHFKIPVVLNGFNHSFAECSSNYISSESEQKPTARETYSVGIVTPRSEDNIEDIDNDYNLSPAPRNSNHPDNSLNEKSRSYCDFPDCFDIKTKQALPCRAVKSLALLQDETNSEAPIMHTPNTQKFSNISVVLHGLNHTHIDDNDCMFSQSALTDEMSTNPVISNEKNISDFDSVEYWSASLEKLLDVPLSPIRTLNSPKTEYSQQIFQEVAVFDAESNVVGLENSQQLHKKDEFPFSLASVLDDVGVPRVSDRGVITSNLKHVTPSNINLLCEPEIHHKKELLIVDDAITESDLNSESDRHYICTQEDVDNSQPNQEMDIDEQKIMSIDCRLSPECENSQLNYKVIVGEVEQQGISMTGSLTQEIGTDNVLVEETTTTDCFKLETGLIIESHSTTENLEIHSGIGNEDEVVTLGSVMALNDADLQCTSSLDNFIHIPTIDKKKYLDHHKQNPSVSGTPTREYSIDSTGLLTTNDSILNLTYPLKRNLLCQPSADRVITLTSESVADDIDLVADHHPSKQGIALEKICTDKNFVLELQDTTPVSEDDTHNTLVALNKGIDISVLRADDKYEVKISSNSSSVCEIGSQKVARNSVSSNEIASNKPTDLSKIQHQEAPTVSTPNNVSPDTSLKALEDLASQILEASTPLTTKDALMKIQAFISSRIEAASTSPRTKNALLKVQTLLISKIKEVSTSFATESALSKIQTDITSEIQDASIVSMTNSGSSETQTVLTNTVQGEMTNSALSKLQTDFIGEIQDRSTGSITNSAASKIQTVSTSKIQESTTDSACLRIQTVLTSEIQDVSPISDTKSAPSKIQTASTSKFQEATSQSASPKIQTDSTSKITDESTSSTTESALSKIQTVSTSKIQESTTDSASSKVHTISTSKIQEATTESACLKIQTVLTSGIQDVFPVSDTKSAPTKIQTVSTSKFQEATSESASPKIQTDSTLKIKDESTFSTTESALSKIQTVSTSKIQESTTDSASSKVHTISTSKIQEATTESACLRIQTVLTSEIQDICPVLDTKSTPSKIQTVSTTTFQEATSEITSPKIQTDSTSKIKDESTSTNESALSKILTDLTSEIADMSIVPMTNSGSSKTQTVLTNTIRGEMTNALSKMQTDFIGEVQDGSTISITNSAASKIQTVSTSQIQETTTENASSKVHTISTSKIQEATTESACLETQTVLTSEIQDVSPVSDTKINTNTTEIREASTSSMTDSALFKIQTNLTNKIAKPTTTSTTECALSKLQTDLRSKIYDAPNKKSLLKIHTFISSKINEASTSPSIKDVLLKIQALIVSKIEEVSTSSMSESASTLIQPVLKSTIQEATSSTTIESGSSKIQTNLTCKIHDGSISAITKNASTKIQPVLGDKFQKVSTSNIQNASSPQIVSTNNVQQASTSLTTENAPYKMQTASASQIQKKTLGKTHTAEFDKTREMKFEQKVLKILCPFTSQPPKWKNTPGSIFSNSLLEPDSFSIEHQDSKVIAQQNVDVELDKLLETEEKRMRIFIMGKTSEEVRTFLKSELASLKMSVRNGSCNYLKNKLIKYDKVDQLKPITRKILKERCFWFKRLNMFIFGNGRNHTQRRHLNILNGYIKHESTKKSLGTQIRHSLLQAYNHIFGGRKHDRVNYYNCLKAIGSMYRKPMKNNQRR